MLRRTTRSKRKGEEGVVILLVAIVLLFIVAAMAALAIDLVTIYTARSEAQQAADGGALAGARVLANSGMTTDATNTALSGAAKLIAITVAMQVASNNSVGGSNLNGGVNCGQEICVTFNDGDASFGTNPRVTVQVNRTNLPTFFARIWGRNLAAVRATATAEAYNASGADALGQLAKRIAPTCVKPWVLPNMASPTNKIFDENTGAIQDVSLLGQSVDGGLGGLSLTCSSNCGVTQAGHAWRFFPGNQSSFPAPPPTALQTCSLALTPYQQSTSGCVQTRVTCGENSAGVSSSVDLDTASTATGSDTQVAVDCLTHAQNNFGDTIDPTVTAGQPFQYVGGNDNPVAGAQATHVMVSDSLITAPVVDVSPGANFPAGSAQVIGFVQFFLNPIGSATPTDHVPARIINMTGCGKNATGQPILGNGASPVMVRLVVPLVVP